MDFRCRMADLALFVVDHYVVRLYVAVHNAFAVAVI